MQLTVGPVLYAIALRPDDASQVRAAVELASRWWGGIAFPWLPLDEGGAVTMDAQEMCGILDVAGIIDLTRPDDSAAVPEGLQQLDLPVTRDQRPQWAMPVRAVIPAGGEAELFTAKSPADDTSLVELVAVGTVVPDESGGWEELGQNLPAAQDDEESLFAQVEGRTVIGATATGTDTSVASEGLFPTTSALIWVLPDSFSLPEVARDLALFWNYRALRLHRRTVTVLVRRKTLGEPDVRRRLMEAISATAFSTPMCVINGLAIQDCELTAVAAELGFRVTDGTTWSERHGPHPEPIEPTAVIDSPLASFWMGERHTGTSRDALAIACPPRWQARIESPIHWRYPEAHQGLVSARITSPVITGPSSDAVAALYHRDSRWLAGGIRIFTRATPTYRLDLGMPQPAEVLSAALATRGRAFTTSDKGREIDGILTACENLSLFRSPAFHAVTAALTPQPSPRIEKALKELAERIALDPEMSTAADELRDITSRARAKPPGLNALASHPAVRSQKLGRADVSAVLTEMLAHRLVTWGYERNCDLCGLTGLEPLSSATPVPRCPGCGRDASYTRRDHEPELHYALSGLLQRVSRNSGLTPLAAAAALRQQGYYVVPGATITGGTCTPDTDLLAWNGYHLLAGEAKAAGALFSQDKLTLEINEAARMGATIFLLTCPEPLPREVVASALEAAQVSDVQLLQLTGDSLTSGMPMTHAVLEPSPEGDQPKPGKEG